MFKRLIVPGLLAVAVLFPARSEAAPCVGATLADLIAAGGTCTEGDKTFSDFTVAFSNQTGTTSPADASVIFVNSFTVSATEMGLLFTGSMFAATNSTLDILIGYTVTSSADLISDIHLSFGGATVVGTGTVDITETAFSGGPVGQVSGQVSLGVPVFNGGVDLDGTFTTVDVSKLISLNGGSAGFASLDFVTQTVTQVPVPEPGTLVLLGTGLLAVGAAMRQRRRRKDVA